jgi:hypothetical protein
LGTPKDNMQDMSKKGRNVKVFGERNGNSKLTETQVFEIIEDLKTMNCSDVGRKRNVPIRTVNDIKNGVRWGWLTGKSKPLNFECESGDKLQSIVVENMTVMPYVYTRKRGNLKEVIRSPHKLNPIPEGYELHPVHYMGIENPFGSILPEFLP